MHGSGLCPQLPSLCNLDSFLKVIIPDEQDDSITTKMVPVRRTMTTKDVCTYYTCLILSDAWDYFTFYVNPSLVH